MADFKPLPKPVNAPKKTQKVNDPRTVTREAKPDDRKTTVKVVQPKMVKETYKGVGASVSGVPEPGAQRTHQRRRDNPQGKSNFQKQARKAYRFLRKNSRRMINIGIALILAVSLISLLMWFMAGNNALAVYLGDDHFAYIAFSQDLDEDILRAEVISRLEDRVNASVQVNEQIMLRPASSAQRNVLPFNEAVEQLAATLDFQIIGTAIEVNGYRVAVLRTQSEAEEIIWRLQSPFLRGSSGEYDTVEFVEDFHLVSATVDESALSSVQHAMHRLDSRSVVVNEYTVQSGDTLGGIALRHNITLTQLFNDNPGFSANTILRVGDALQIQSYQPFLSVRTIMYETHREPIPIEFQPLENPGEVNTFSQTIQEGIEGEREVVTRIIRINGIQTEGTQIVETRTIREMEPEIVEVGTLEVAVDRR